MKKLLVSCCCISALAATAALAQPNEYTAKLSPADTAILGKGLADKIKEAQELLTLVQKLQQQLDAQNKATAPPPMGANPSPPPEEAKP